MSNINSDDIHSQKSISEKSISGNNSYKLTLPKFAHSDLVEWGSQNTCNFNFDEHHASSKKSYQSLDLVENFQEFDMLLSVHDQTLFYGQFHEDLL